MKSLLIGTRRRRALRATLAAVLALAFAAVCAATELEQATIDAFNHYVRVAEQQAGITLQPDGPFLWIDSRPASSRTRYYEQLRSGQYVIKQLRTYDDGRSIDIPDGMIHHWLGIAFVRGATLQSAEAVFEDYRDYAKIYKPQVRRSRIISRKDDGFQLYLQLYKSSPREVAYNADFDVQRMSFGPDRIASSSVSTRIAQLENPSDKNSPELPVGNDSGYLWRLNDYWRYEQKDGGVYMQVETISLSRDVPAILSWFVKPIIHRIARETIASLLDANRRAMQNPGAYAPDKAAGSDAPSGTPSRAASLHASH